MNFDWNASNYKLSYNFPWNFSNDRSQAYIKMNMKWLWLQKDLEHKYVSPRNLNLSLKKIHYSLRKLPFLWATIMSLGRRNLCCPNKQPCAQGASTWAAWGSLNPKPMIGHKCTNKRTCDGCDCKNIWNICFLGELGPFHGENSSFPKEVAFLLGNFFYSLHPSCFWGYFICSLGNVFAPWRTSIVP